MKYYVVAITDSTGDKHTKSIYEYEDVNAAIARFHSTIGTAMNNTECIACLILVIDGNGSVYRSEKYVKE